MVERSDTIKDIAIFDAGLSTTGTIRIAIRQCAVCGCNKPCLCTDTSEGEYHEGCICKSCLDSEFEGVE